MKFTKTYETYMRGIRAEEELPGVGLKQLKKMLKKCRSELSSHQETTACSSSDADASGGGRCAGHCSGKNKTTAISVFFLGFLVPIFDPGFVQSLVLSGMIPLLLSEYGRYRISSSDKMTNP